MHWSPLPSPSAFIHTAITHAFISLARTCSRPSRFIGSSLRRPSHDPTGANPHWRLDTDTRSGLSLHPSERPGPPPRKGGLPGVSMPRKGGLPGVSIPPISFSGTWLWSHDPSSQHPILYSLFQFLYPPVPF
ncbi:hypothetical protein EGW08_003027 [Elysia chlorotica]|uniref:Uncharacterized protein n=1 Tax=Elysia chlorotica TaxID=188477 RepID=A0A433U5W8_ELYCH|nr:hypothetical protein EGW08_003027 [Elysia chlorotica]